MRPPRPLPLLAAALLACPAAAFELESPRFAEAGEIPPEYSCEGPDVSPPLVWKDVPAGTKSLALVVDDPDAPDPKAPRTRWVHWVLYGLPPDGGGLPEAVTPRELPHGALEGRNDWKRVGWGGPCPPVGRHRYFFRLHALDTVLPDLDEPTRRALDAAMQGHVLDTTELMGTYEKSD